MNDTVTEPIIIKFDQPAEQTVDGITRISGFVKAKHFLPLIDNLDLEANPRSSKVGPVTDAIRYSIQNTPDDFPFKTKGVLLGSSEYERLDRGRVRVTFDNTELEGILDGGHNTLAIGLHVLELALGSDARLKKVKLWAQFRELWNESREQIRAFRAEAGTAEDADGGALDFLIPVELIVPEDAGDPLVVDDFRASLLDICAARNNNVQLRAEAKANQHGYFDDLKSLLPKAIADKVEWKTNDGGFIKAADVISLAWVPLALLDPMPVDEDGRKVDAPVPQNIYRNKGDCVARFERLMSSKEVTSANTGGFKKELKSTRVHSALKIAAQMPELYDRVYADFPKAYNALGGKYGRIVAVAKMNTSSKSKHARFTGAKVDYNSPEGFIIPLVYGLTGLLEHRADGTIDWQTDPFEFLAEHLQDVVKQFTILMAPFQYDPQKVGKGQESYALALSAFQNELLRSGKGAGVGA
ncbi:hypothetical protein ACFFGH_28400 [Lysobacter korlensis]|uniref:Abortive phage infection protein n=1 Tax=Lysobacter korlensis TaxID=553636 RepID=A0ABV6RXQ9_9GAMM